MIVFFRHGKTLWNLQGRLQGRESDSLLLPLDKEFIECLNQEFKNIVFDKVYLSPLKRATDFFNKIKLKALCVELKDDIKEIGFGVLSGLAPDEIERSILEKRENDKWNFRPQNGESYADLYKRLEPVKDLIESGSSLNIALVAHETANKVLIGKLMNYSKDKILSLKQPNDVIYKIDEGILYKKQLKEGQKWVKL